DDQQVDRRRLRPGHRERAPGRRQADVRERFVLRGDPPLADAGPLDDPLVVRVDELCEVVVRQHALGHVAAETRDRDARPRSTADHSLPTANISVPRTASSPSTVARTLPRPTGPRTVSTSHSSVRTSPGRTTRLKRTSSMPAKSASLP